jgi:hypothetical protein
MLMGMTACHQGEAAKLHNDCHCGLLSCARLSVHICWCEGWYRVVPTATPGYLQGMCILAVRLGGCVAASYTLSLPHAWACLASWYLSSSCSLRPVPSCQHAASKHTNVDMTVTCKKAVRPADTAQAATDAALACNRYQQPVNSLRLQSKPSQRQWPHDRTTTHE